MHFLHAILLLGTISYIINTRSCITSSSFTPIAPSTITAILANASQHYIEIIAGDPLFASEARLLEADSFGLWIDYPFFFRDVSTNIKTLPPPPDANPNAFEMHFRAFWTGLLETMTSFTDEILNLLPSHVNDLAVVDRAINNHLFRSFLVNNPIVKTFSDQKCRRLPLRLLPPLVPAHHFERSLHHSAITLLSTYLSVLDTHTERLQALNSTLNNLTLQLSHVTKHIHGLITTTTPPPDLSITSIHTHTLSYNGSTILWTSLSTSTRGKIILWHQFTWKTRATPLQAFGAYPAFLLDGWRRKENPVLETQKWDVWKPRNRVLWMRVDFLERLVRDGVQRTETARVGIEEAIRRIDGELMEG